jgi:6-phosphofructokinase
VQADFFTTVKYIDPSYAIRSVPACPSDSVYCWNMARNAVHAGMAGNTAMLIGRWHGRFVQNDELRQQNANEIASAKRRAARKRMQGGISSGDGKSNDRMKKQVNRRQLKCDDAYLNWSE